VIRALAALLAASLAATPQIRIDVRLVRVIATVKNAAGQVVGGLTRDKFRIEDSGVAQEIAVFEPSTALPLSVAVLIDASGSTAKDLPSEIASVKRFYQAILRQGNPDDAVSILSFNYDVAQVSPFTRREARLEAGLKRIKGEAGTSLYDAIHLASAELETREGRKAIAIVTDGGDTTSTYTFRDALKAAHQADAVVYPIVVQPIVNDTGRNVGGENALASLADGTGGRVFLASLGEALDEAFSAVLRDLRTQYLLAYYPRNLPPNSPAFRPIRVTLAEPGLRVSARSGYYGDSR